MSPKNILPLLVVLAFLAVACSPTITEEPSAAISPEQDAVVSIPVTGEEEAQIPSGNDLSSSAGLEEKSVARSMCLLDGDLPRHIGGCVDYFSPDLSELNTINNAAPGTPCIPEDDQPRHHSMCVE